jgi:hypothetical protein
MTFAAPIVALTLLLPPSAQAPASGQAASADPTAATLAVKRGEKVFVSRIAGTETVSGRVLRLADDGLVLGDRGVSETIPYRELERVLRARDSVWNGALIGYGLGFVTGAILVLADPCNSQPGSFINLCFNQPEFAVAFGGLITGPAGMAAGAIADALRKKPRVVFDRRTAPRVSIAITPTLTRGGGGFRAAITF